MIKTTQNKNGDVDQEYELLTLDCNNNDFLDINVLEESKVFNIGHDILNEIISQNSMILFDANKFIKNIMESYHYNVDEINHQFTVDFTRSSLTYNNKKMLDRIKTLNKFKLYSKYDFNMHYHEVNTSFKLDTILLMLCTQASFAFSFALMHQAYSDYNKNLCVTSNDIKFVISNTNETINIKMNAIYNLKNLCENVNSNQINIQTNIDFVYKNNTYELCKFGIIYWQCH